MDSLGMDMKQSSLFIHLRSKYLKSSCESLLLSPVLSPVLSLHHLLLQWRIFKQEVQSEQVLYDCTWLNASSLLLILLYRQRRVQHKSLSQSQWNYWSRRWWWDDVSGRRTEVEKNDHRLSFLLINMVSLEVIISWKRDLVAKAMLLSVLFPCIQSPSIFSTTLFDRLSLSISLSLC